MSTRWYVQGDPDDATFGNKLAAERWARFQFPYEDGDKRYARIFYREGVTHDELWKAQLAHWPDSIELTADEMIDWAYAGTTEGEQSRRFRVLALTLQCEERVFYRTCLPAPGKRSYIGCRYGVEGSEYMSGFNDGED